MDAGQLYIAADMAGMKAVQALQVTPMIVTEHANPIDDNSAVTRQWHVADGVCGFASVIVKPANSAFARFLISQGLARKHFQGGVLMSVVDYNQSLQKKEAYAKAFAAVLESAGIRCYVDSRMD